MAKAKTPRQIKRELEIELNNKLKQAFNKLSAIELKRIGDDFVEIMKTDIADGISPIQKAGRFPRYKDPEKYPKPLKNKFPNKRQRPVNLYLSGDFMRNLKAWLKSSVSSKTPFKYSLFVGFLDKKSILKEQGHREGVNGQPKRPVIPEGDENFNRKLIQELKDSLTRAINKKLAK